MNLSDRMKMYENVIVDQRLMPKLPVFARIDGRSFHSFTRGMTRPYDMALVSTMKAVTKRLVEDTSALVGYTQSDEITLCWFSDDVDSQIYFDGRVFKMVSTLASSATFLFNKFLATTTRSDYIAREPTFDCRVWSVPSLEEAANVFVWREQDAVRNSITSAARTKYSHKELIGKNTKEMHEMLFKEGINWSTYYPDCFKRGSYYLRRIIETPFTAEEIDKLPSKHAARKNPNLVVKRSKVVFIDIPPIVQIVNRVGFLFHNEDAKVTPDETLKTVEE